MDTLFPGLTAHSSTRDLLAHLVGLHLAGGEGLAQARQALETSVAALAGGDGTGRQFALTCPDRTITIGQFLAPMDAGQAGRFLDELFDDIVPHLASKRSLLERIASGADAAGNPLSRLVAATLGQIQRQEVDAHVSVEVRALTWVDDHARDFNSRVSLEISHDAGPSPAARVKF